MTPGGIVILGAGELSSAVAWRVFRSGYLVLMTEMASPLAVRRRVCFSEAVRHGEQTVEGVTARLADMAAAGFRTDRIGVLVDPDGGILARARPQAVIDGRMRKRPTPRPEGYGGTVIGLGPGFSAPGDADFVIETHRGARMGEVIDRGAAAPNTGVPGLVGGEAGKRVVHAPCAGRFRPGAAIGDLVVEGQLLGSIAGVPIHAPLTGLLRGLVGENAELKSGTKVADIDPRGAAVDPGRMTDKALAIAGGVLEALLRVRITPPPGPSRGAV